jgi:hypothetical protein
MVTTPTLIVGGAVDGVRITGRVDAQVLQALSTRER